jgi:outer membrane lipoprotein-sorting protein
MKKIIFLAIAAFAAMCTLSAQDAKKIMDDARDRMEGFGSGGNMGTQDTMVITKKNGDKSERKITQYSKDDKDGNARTVVIFEAPKTVAGTRFLTIDNDSDDTDQWIYMPNLRKVRRIVSSEKGGSFMGTDFSYDDISITSRDDDDDTHNYLRQEKYNGDDCHVIETISADKDYQYSKVLSWVSVSEKLIRKMDLYDAKGVMVKVLELKKYEDIDGHMTPKEMTISTVKEGSSTTIYVDRIEYDMSDKRLPDSVFTTRFLETGRP